ncbi:MAG: T9SS type A sorting domain-containing protein, partial [Candidatus Edwardsbacteria bacterium]|nr:T9SS type A sorting domain-containing protein [Candidatus Edwardsbacteria bacterium]
GGMGVAFRPEHVPWPDRSLKLRHSPNPFTATAEISFQTAAEGPVELAVYNGIGQRVRTLVDRRLGPGLHAARWDGRNDAGRRLAAGVYLCRLQTTAGAAAQRMVLVK